jgi:hypothetical protein
MSWAAEQRGPTRAGERRAYRHASLVGLATFISSQLIPSLMLPSEPSDHDHPDPGRGDAITDSADLTDDLESDGGEIPQEVCTFEQSNVSIPIESRID